MSTSPRPLWAGRSLALIGIVLVAFNLRTAVASLSPILTILEHDVTLARGPVGFASPWLRHGAKYAHRFTAPGTYLLHCSLHSAYMSQVIKVTAKRAKVSKP